MFCLKHNSYSLFCIVYIITFLIKNIDSCPLPITDKEWRYRHQAIIKNICNIKMVNNVFNCDH